METFISDGRIIAGLVIFFCLSFIFSLYLSFGSPQVTEDYKVGSSQKSVSAIGYNALYNFLLLDHKIVYPEARFAPRRTGLLLLNEPNLKNLSTVELSEFLNANRILLILPKWEGKRSTKNKREIESVYLYNEDSLNLLLGMVFDEGRLARLHEGKQLQPTIVYCSKNSFNTKNFVLNLPHQFVQSSEIASLIETPEGVLFGKIKGRKNDLWILTDPDLLSNHGLDNNANAYLVKEIMDHVMGSDKTIIFDQAIFGKKESENIINQLFRLPSSLITIFLLFFMVICFWAGIRPLEKGKTEDIALKFNQQRLIQNTAHLLSENEYSHFDIGMRYYRTLLRHAASSLYAPAGLAMEEMEIWLGRFRAGKKLGYTYTDLRKSLGHEQDRHGAISTTLIDFSKKIHLLNQELVYGFRKNQKHL